MNNIIYYIYSYFTFSDQIANRWTVISGGIAMWLFAEHLMGFKFGIKGFFIGLWKVISFPFFMRSWTKEITVNWEEMKVNVNSLALSVQTLSEVVGANTVKIANSSKQLDNIQKEITYNGGTKTTVSVVKEIKEATQQLVNAFQTQDSQEKALRYLDIAPTFTCDPTGKVESVNLAWQKMVGARNEEEMLGWGWLRAMPNQKIARENAIAFAADPRSVTGQEVIFKHLVKKKTFIHTTCTARVVRDQNGTFIRVIGTLQINKIVSNGIETEIL